MFDVEKCCFSMDFFGQDQFVHLKLWGLAIFPGSLMQPCPGSDLITETALSNLKGARNILVIFI